MGRNRLLGLIYVYMNGATPPERLGQINGSSEWGSISSIPRIHGLGLWKQGHVGVYVGNGMFVDNSEPGVNMRYQAVTTRLWGTSARWYKVPGVAYPTTGWVTFNGNKYYYENGRMWSVVPRPSTALPIPLTPMERFQGGPLRRGYRESGDDTDGRQRTGCREAALPARRFHPQRLRRSRPIQSCL